MDKGQYFHDVYRIQVKLGRTYAELEPYALFPLTEYFGGSPRQEPVRPCPVGRRDVEPIRPPLLILEQAA
jgi:hypothetical protein